MKESGFMDKIREYVKNLRFKKTMLNGFDKESVYLVLKELVALFEQELMNYQTVNKNLQDEINHFKEHPIQNKENTDLQQFKKIMHSYAQLEKQLAALKDELKEKDILIEALKDQSQKEINQIKKQYQQDLPHPVQISQKEESIEFIQNQYQSTIQTLTEEFYQKNNELIVENRKLKEQIEQMNLQSHSSDIEKEMQSLLDSMNRLKNKYIKED